MGRTRASSSKQRKVAAKPKKDTIKPKKATTAKQKKLTTYTMVQECLDGASKQAGKSQKTLEAYAGHIKRAIEWIKQMAEDEEHRDETWDMTKELLGFDEAEDNEGETATTCGHRNLPGSEAAADGMPADLVKAFDGPPRKCTPMAIALFITDKCLGEERCGTSTADGIRAAFLYHYNKLDGDTYRGRWQYDNWKNQWVGNPTSSTLVEDAFRACKNKDGEPERRHSRPMHLEDMDKIFRYIRTVSDDMNNEGTPQLHTQAECLVFMALASLAWTIWTRNSEISNLQVKHFDFHPDLPPNHCGPNTDQIFKVNLRNRKNWQTKTKKGEHQLNGHTYLIPSQPDEPAVDAYEHVLLWLNFYQTNLLKRPLGPEDYIFPMLTAGRAQPNRAMTKDCIQKQIKELANAAGIKGAEQFSTHCFRRGGAQYRFMYAPRKKRWALARIRWWGGWAQGEHRDTLIRYLLDELNTYEEDHSRALCPNEPTENLYCHLDGNLDHRTMSAAEEKDCFATAFLEMRNLHTKVDQSMHLINTVAQDISNCYQNQVRDPQHYYRYPAHLPHPNSLNIAEVFAPEQLPCASNLSITYPDYPTPLLLPHGALLNPSLPAANPNDRYHTALTDPVLSEATWIHRPSQYQHQQPYHSRSRHRKSTVEFLASQSGHAVPEITRSFGDGGWRQVIKDWDAPDLSRNHLVVLKDWKKEWARNNQQYHYRKTIALEFIESYSRDETQFCAEYPTHSKGITALFQEIQARKKATGLVKSRNRK